MTDLPHLTVAVDEQEWAELRQQWPSAVHSHVRLEVNDPFLTGHHQELLSDGRRAEICYVAYERSPESGVLLHVKTIYPADAFRLPTGGIAPGEGVLASLAREITEETGLQMGDSPDTVQLRELLGVLSYEFAHLSLARSYGFATYIFLVELPAYATIVPQDPTERIAAWRWNPTRELTNVAETLDTLGERSPAWADWGHFRALSHRLVSDLLSGIQRTEP